MKMLRKGVTANLAFQLPFPAGFAHVAGFPASPYPTLTNLTTKLVKCELAGVHTLRPVAVSVSLRARTRTPQPPQHQAPTGSIRNIQSKPRQAQTRRLLHTLAGVALHGCRSSVGSLRKPPCAFCTALAHEKQDHFSTNMLVPCRISPVPGACLGLLLSSQHSSPRCRTCAQSSAS